MASSYDEKLAESVRKYPVLYDKSCSGFKEEKETRNNLHGCQAAVLSLNYGNPPEVVFDERFLEPRHVLVFLLSASAFGAFALTDEGRER